MRSITVLVILLFTTLIYSQRSTPEVQKQKIDSLLTESHKRGFFNGNALVAVDGDIIYQDEFGYAKADKSEKLNRNHIFKIGSVSKEFDGVAIMLLIQQGKLSLDSTVSQYFPSLSSWAKKVSIKDLLQYTSGLPNTNTNKIRSDEQAWVFLKNLDSLEFEPGSAYLYNNLNTFLRKRIVEKIFGRSYSEFVKENLLAPAGIKNAIIDPKPSDGNLPESFNSEFVKEDFPAYMSGWVALDIQALFTWINSLHSGKIIDQNSMDILFQNFQNNQSTLGSVVIEDGKLHYQYHHGQSGHYEASFYYNEKEKFTVIFLTNQRGNNLGDLTNAVDAILRGEEFSIPKKSIEVSLRSKIYHRGYDEGMKFFNHIKQNESHIYDFKNEEKELLETAEYLSENKRREDALKLLEFISVKFPDSNKAILQFEKLKTGRY